MGKKEEEREEWREGRKEKQPQLVGSTGEPRSPDH